MRIASFLKVDFLTSQTFVISALFVVGAVAAVVAADAVAAVTRKDSGRVFFVAVEPLVTTGILGRGCMQRNLDMG